MCWTAASPSIYTREARVGDSFGTVTIPLTDTSERIEIVPFNLIGAEAIGNVNVTLVEN